MNGTTQELSLLFPLTCRESDVIALIAEGKSRKKIARELEISQKTVNAHCDNISQKLTGPGRFAVRATLYWVSSPSSS